jgi:hypothetical protein
MLTGERPSDEGGPRECVTGGGEISGLRTGERVRYLEGSIYLSISIGEDTFLL